MKTRAQNKEVADLVSQHQKLGEIKYYIINGETKLARRELLKIDSQSPLAAIIKDRYLALLHFIEGEHELSLKLLGSYTFSTDVAYGKVCLLKIMNLLILNKSNTLKDEFSRCSKMNNNYTQSYDWITSLINLKLKDQNLLSGKKIARDIEFTHELPTLKIWLKLALFLNKEELVLPLISNLPIEAYENQEMRELIGFIYYRKKKFKSTMNFIEDLSTPNSENVKGNIYLEKKQYELAYGQFKLALSKKQNSYNAIERSLPLAWLLNQWDDGLELSRKIILNDRNEAQRLTLEAAFLNNLKKYDEAGKSLERAQGFFGNHPPKELAQLYAYVSMMREDQYTFKKYIHHACEESDGISCWMILSNQVWEDFTKTIKREDPLNLGQELTLDALKAKVELDPIQDSRKIDQRDIEELDESTASLVKKK